tara:strand:+ start:49020 stop:49325 length:306 start_codon:yes stop_codon:yes gene_type:complete
MNNYRKAYHKGKYRNGEWGKHLRPFQKRIGNKRWRRTSSILEKEIILKSPSYKKRKKIKVKITTSTFGGRITTSISKYRTLSDAKNAINRPNVVRATILED